MKFSFWFGLIFFCAAEIAAGASWTVKVTVLDQELGSPLEGAKLSVTGSPQVFASDAQGDAVLALSPSTQTLLLTAQLPGYETKKVVLRPSDTEIVVKMLLSGVIEGQDLVVERARPQQTESQAGVSQAVNHRDIQSTAKIGLREDVMTTIKTLPGVGYSGALGGARPTIRGGDPNETTATLDGAYILDPYYWGGAYSIFNPDWVDSAVLSDGVTSAQYGQFIAGLLDVSSLTPNQVVHGSFDLSTTGVDGFLQTPIGNDAGLMLGGNVTTLDYILKAVGAGSAFSQAPYYRTGFARLTWSPNPSLKTFLNAYFGQDGVGVANNSTDQALTTDETFTYKNPETFVTTGAKVLVDNRNQMNFLFHFNSFNQALDAQSVLNGTKDFDQDFINQFHPSTNSFTLNDLTSQIGSDFWQYLYQFKFDWDWEAAPGQTFSFGQEALAQYWTRDRTGNSWQIVQNSDPPTFEDVPLNQPPQNGNVTWTQALFALYDFTLIPNVLTGELGLRVDDSTIFDGGSALATQPAVNPRLLTTYTFLRDWEGLKSLSLVGGTGLFSQFPTTDPYVGGQSNFEIGPERAWFNELGWEAVTKDDWKFDFTGYWRYDWGRYYDVLDPNTLQTSLNTNGTGDAYGFDVFFQKETRYWQTWLSYSFIVVRLYDPGTSGQTATNGDPLGQWFYPSYQRFHNLSYVLTVNPVDGFSITTEAQVASGVPVTSLGAVQSNIGYLPQGNPSTLEPIEYFSQSSTYSDALRSGWVYPVDVKLTWYGYFADSKVQWQFYLGVQDIFAALYYKSSLGNAPLDMWYGNSLSGGMGANFSAGVPIPSIGYTLSF